MSDSIVGLINKLNRTVFLPAIQRSFVWEEDRICMLFDSILRNFPIGAATIWYTHENVQCRRFLEGNISDVEEMALQFMTVPPTKPVGLVLDGQQRLQAINLAFHGQINGKVLHFNILSTDKEDRSEARFEFKFYKQSETDEANMKSRQRFEDSPDAQPEIWVRVPELISLGNVHHLVNRYL
ncbi:DUF262 domain-containing protein, partial [bacterium]|nr:DUF262 domain-containing protein [bacterium]